MKWVGISTYVGKGETFTGFWLEEHLKELGLNGRTILKWIIKKRNGEAWIRYEGVLISP